MSFAVGTGALGRWNVRAIQRSNAFFVARFIGCVCCCSLLVLLASCGGAVTNDPRLVAQQFADAIVAEDYAAAAEFLSEPFQPEAAMLLPLLRDQIEADIGSLESASAGEVRLLNAEQSEVTVTWNGSRNRLPSRWQMQRENGAWRIVNFQLEAPEDSLA